MEDFNSETDSDYTSYWRDWVGDSFFLSFGIAKLTPRPCPPSPANFHALLYLQHVKTRSVNKYVAASLDIRKRGEAISYC